MVTDKKVTSQITIFFVVNQKNLKQLKLVSRLITDIYLVNLSYVEFFQVTRFDINVKAFFQHFIERFPSWKCLKSNNNWIELVFAGPPCALWWMIVAGFMVDCFECWWGWGLGREEQSKESERSRTTNPNKQNQQKSYNTFATYNKTQSINQRTRQLHQLTGNNLLPSIRETKLLNFHWQCWPNTSLRSKPRIVAKKINKSSPTTNIIWRWHTIQTIIRLSDITETEVNLSQKDTRGTLVAFQLRAESSERLNPLLQPINMKKFASPKDCFEKCCKNPWLL